MQNRFHIATLGCKLNYSESSHIARELQKNGFEKSSYPDYFILNTCTVTGVAEKKARSLIMNWHRRFPNSIIIVIGCFAARDKELVENLPGVAKVFGSEDKMNVIPFLLEKTLIEKPLFFAAFSSSERTRSFLKIQDGCDYHCSYCAVARVRGKSRSDTIANVLTNLEKIAQLNCKEVVLTGVNTGDFGRGNGETFTQLLKEIDNRKLIERVRISSIEPNLITGEMIKMFANSNILMPHFHIPLQSGSNRVLAAMKRRYKTELFEDIVYQINTAMPHACIAVDMISGFPSETEADFEETIRFLNSMPISYLHVFTYSKRPQTQAAEMKPQMKDSMKKERTKILLHLSEIKKISFYNKHLNTKRDVLFEEDIKNGSIFGFTDNYIRISVPFNENLINQIKKIELTELNTTKSHCKKTITNSD
ncbi:MAG: tRNA (N(6)-L-threonylcarbamoyladenosine(37)-C(2))-methylthiotransferase MtaB [Bacteroidales bacterium]|jgi:threonylcarbamoyladenosine tRNA methylthiotransferase MtaB|nr:tRNA (N(6)-L-threonylcarbamoyladenosine(37)-C(2))-methylthiotransferase MtaB [Bacteroidales bacterium]